MNDAGSEGRVAAIRKAIDFNIVADNVTEIADFTVEKHEYKSGRPLAPEVREKAISRINDALWQRIEALKARRQKHLEEMFSTAQAALDEVVGEG